MILNAYKSSDKHIKLNTELKREWTLLLNCTSTRLALTREHRLYDRAANSNIQCRIQICRPGPAAQSNSTSSIT